MNDMSMLSDRYVNHSNKGQEPVCLMEPQTQKELWSYYLWLMNGGQRGKVLLVLDSNEPLPTSKIRDKVRMSYRGSAITQRSVIRIIKDLQGEGLCQLDGRNVIRKGVGKAYAPTKLGELLQKIIRRNDYKWIGKPIGS